MTALLVEPYTSTLYVLPRLFIAPLIFGAIAVSACSGAASHDDRRVAVIGDTPAELQRGILTARQTGRIPLFVQLTCARRAFAFSPYAQVARTPDAIVVRAYSKIYVFPLANAGITYDGTPVRANSLPVVDAAALHVHAAFGSCVPQQRPAARYALLTDPWNGAKDPWQRGEPAAPWTSGAQLDALTVPYGHGK